MLTFYRKINNICAVARFTWMELRRQRHLLSLLILGVMLLFASILIGELTPFEQFRMIREIGLTAIRLSSFLVVTVATAQMIPKEKENQTLDLIFSKPITRTEYLFGKYGGTLLLLLQTIVVTGFLLFVILTIRKLLDSSFAFTPHSAIENFSLLSLFISITIIAIEQSVIAAIALALSTVASSVSFTLLITLIVYLIGHLQTYVRELWLEQGLTFFRQAFLNFTSFLIPNFDLYDLSLRASQLPYLFLYSSIYILILLTCASWLWKQSDNHR